MSPVSPTIGCSIGLNYSVVCIAFYSLHISQSNSKYSGTTIIAGAESDHINWSVNMLQAEFDPPAQSHASYEASALLPSHHGWTGVTKLFKKLNCWKI